MKSDMPSDSSSQIDEELLQRLRSMSEVQLDAQTETRMRIAVLHRVDQGQFLFGWLTKPLWRPVLAALLPFTTGLAFGQSDYLHETQVLIELQDPIELATSIEAAHSLLELYSLHPGTLDAD